MWHKLNWLVVGSLLAACSSGSVEVEGAFKAEVWADNWFSLAVGEDEVGEDSVPITTERSFNQETLGFDATYPLVLNFTVKDYKENDTGLEYIGEDNQQMGDGGFIAQITHNSSGEVIAVTNSSWRCLVIHKAPLNVECEDSSNPEAECQSQISEEPDGWKAADYDVSGWPTAMEYTEDEVGAKEGYNDVDWDKTARLIWSESLTQDNTLLCKLVVTEA